MGHPVIVIRSLVEKAYTSGMWLAIAMVLIVLWICGFLLFHVAVFALHVLLIIAAVALVVHFIIGGRRAI